MEKIERTEGTFAKNFKVVMDLQALPSSLSVDIFVKLADSGFIFYDSERGPRPRIYMIEEGTNPKIIPTFVDIKGEELDFKTIKDKWDKEEEWRKELYKCRMSPIHYFTNYVSTNPKPTQNELEDYLSTINMQATEDSDDLENRDMIERRKEYAKGIIMEDIQALKVVRDKVEKNYANETLKLLKEVIIKHNLSGKVDKAVVDAMIRDILKTPTKGCSEDLKYYITDKRGLWDKPLLGMTDKDVLVRLWKQI